MTALVLVLSGGCTSFGSCGPEDGASEVAETGGAGEASACADEEVRFPQCDRSAPWTSVTAGQWVTCGVHADGCGECWGAPDFSELPEDDDSWGPPPVTSGWTKRVPAGPWDRILLSGGGGGGSGCGVRPNGNIVCWSKYPDAPFGGTYTSVASGLHARVCALNPQHELECTTGSVDTFASMPPVVSFREDAAIDRDGGLWVKITPDDWTGEYVYQPFVSSAGPPYVNASGNLRVYCGIGVSGEVACKEVVDWAGRDYAALERVPAGPFTDVCVGQANGWDWRDPDSDVFSLACALRPNGEVECWGDSPHRPPSGERFLSLSCGYRHVCGLTTRQEIACWGDCMYGECDAPS